MWGDADESDLGRPTTIGLSRRRLLAALAGGASLGAADVTSAMTEFRDAAATYQPRTRSFGVGTDPYIVAGAGIPYFRGENGWDQVPASDRAATVLGLHTDTLDCHRSVSSPITPMEPTVRGGTGQLRTFARRHGRSVSAQNLFTITPSDVFTRWYAALPEADKWHGPGGTRLDSIRDAAGEYFDGQKKIVTFAGTESIVPSIHIPDILKRNVAAAQAHLATGFTDFYLDNVGRAGPLDFSEWARTAFQQHLQSLSANRREALGIDDPAAFDIRDYVVQEGLSSDEIPSPGVDPVLREYVLFHRTAHREFMETMTAEIRAGFPEQRAEEFTLTGNQGMVSFDSFYLSDAFDAIYLEEEHTVPPERIRDFVYKLGTAAGRFEKPVLAIGNMLIIGNEVDTTAGLDPTETYPTLLRLQVGEGYANGGIRTLPLTGWAIVSNDQVVDNWVQADGSVPAPLQTFIDFVWANRRFIKDDAPANDVAVAFSVPTLLWRNGERYWPRDRTHEASFKGATTICRERQIPYDVVALGHHRLWDAPEQRARLGRYEVVVLPAVECLSDAQVNRLRTVLDDGTTVIASGGAPTRAADFTPRSDVEQLLEDHENGVLLDGTPAQDRQRTGESDGSLGDAITDAHEQVRVAASKVGVNVRAQPDHRRRLVHLVNYAYNPQQDAVASRSALQVDVALPFDPAVARWVSPEGTTNLSLGTDGQYTSVTVPTLEEWGFIVFGAEPDSLASPGDAATASDAIAAADSAIEVASAPADAAGGVVEAKVARREARLAKDHEAYEQATAAARRARELAVAAQPALTVGIDQAHGQPDSEWGLSQLGQMMALFDEFTYEPVASVDEATLAELDVFIIPPVLSEFGLEYGFTATELDAIETFVADGGCLLVIGNGAMAEDIDDLAKTFGFQIEPGMVGYPDSELPSTFTTNLSVVGQATITGATGGRSVWNIKFGTPITDPGPATVYGRVAQDSEALVNRRGNPREQNDGDQPAAGTPVAITFTHGKGRVSAVGAPRLFKTPLGGDPPPWVSNWEMLDETLGRVARHRRQVLAAQRSTATTAPTPDSATPTDGSPSERSRTPGASPTRSTAPGFGFGAVLAGIGTGVLLRRLRQDSD